MKNALARFLRDEQGATAIEYGLIAGLISLAIIGTVTQLGVDIGALFTRLSGKVTGILGT
ncbi:Flp family type IVb pilin [Cupriavidus sp. UME77]|uniref:Flp family type IVb pilin n=1 Tax=Cupriavidus sp. UME77 TaxID=1862321 RepID=UPI0016005BEC|nr:Flp family type IVb pilin [Cupriavidus sp. UME77]MBB1632547.1 pilus assembly protein [Cupriavidus sp. UME77]